MKSLFLPKTHHFLFILFYLFVMPRKIHAYLDMGTGSFFFQLLMGFLLGIPFAVKIYWKRIVKLVASFFEKQQRDEKDNE